MKKWSKNGRKWSKVAQKVENGCFEGFLVKKGCFGGGGAWGVPRVSLKVLQKDVLVSSKSIKSALKGKKMVKKC